MTNIEGVSGVLIQPMLYGTEVFIGAKREKNFGPMVMCGLGGILVEVIKDVKSTLAPVSEGEADKMIRSLKGYPIIQGYRGQEGVNQVMFNETIRRVSALCMAAPEIMEMDLNPLVGNERGLTAIDVKIRIEKEGNEKV
jgi:acetyltransferase